MDVITSVLAILVLIGLLILVRRKSKQENARPAVRRPSSTAGETKFHAVSIKFAEDACAAAKSMEGRRFLSTAAPKIPLPECDVLECRCRFVHHDDRRTGADRRNPWAQGIGGGGTGRYEQEQRRGRDRRQDDDDE